MEDLRIIPLLMFFTGILFVYSGFKNTTPLGILRSFLGGASTTSDQTNPYTPTADPFFVGVNTGGTTTYQAPPRGGNPGFFS